MEVAEGLDGLVDQSLGAFPVGHVVEVGDGLAARSRDLVRHQLGRGPVLSGPVRVATEVVDDDLGSLLGKQQSVFPTDASPGSGDDGDSTCERVHYSAPFGMCLSVGA